MRDRIGKDNPKNRQTNRGFSFQKIEDALKPLFAQDSLQFVVLFGSSVSGKFHSRSDIDVAFMFDRPVDIIELTGLTIQLLKRDDVDVLDLRRASPLMQFAVAKTGKLLYERTDGLFDAFRAHAFKKYVDTKKIRDAQKEYIDIFLKTRGVL